MKKCTLYAFFILLLFSCKKENEFVVYNDAIVDSKNIVDSAYSIYNKQINTLINDSLYISILTSTDNIAYTIQAHIIKIKSIKPPTNGNEFKEACIRYFQSLLTVAELNKGYLILNDEKATTVQVDSIKKEIKASEIILDSTFKNLVIKQNEFARLSKIKLTQ